MHLRGEGRAGPSNDLRFAAHRAELAPSAKNQQWEEGAVTVVISDQRVVIIDRRSAIVLTIASVILMAVLI